MPDDILSPLNGTDNGYWLRRLLEVLVAGVDRMQLQLDELLDVAAGERRAPIVNVETEPFVASIDGLRSSMLEAVRRSDPDILVDPKLWADALAGRLSSGSAEVAEALALVTKNLERLSKKVSALSVMPSGGSADAATETTLRLIESRMYRRTDPLPEGTNTIGYVSPSTVRKVAEGKLFRAGAAVDTSVTTPSASILISATTKIVYVVGFGLYADAAADVAFIAGATSTGATITPQNMNLASATTATAQVRVGTSALSGGTEFARARVNTNSPVVRDVFVVLPPGQSLAIRYVGPGATNHVVFNGTFFEESP